MARESSPLIAEPYSFGNPVHGTIAMDHAAHPIVGRALSGQRFSITHVNRHSPLKTIRFDSLWGDNYTDYQQYIATQHAASDPGAGYLSIELPAHGGSDGLTDEQKKSDDIIASVSEAQLEAILDVVPDLHEDLTATGEAVGGVFARQFALQAAKRGIRVRNLFEFDPLGLEKRSPLGLALSHLAVAQTSRLRGNKTADEKEQILKDTFFKKFVPTIAGYGTTKSSSRIDHLKVLAKEPRILEFMLKASPITNSTGMETLEELLEANPVLTAHFVFAGQSVVGRLTDTLGHRLAQLSDQSGGRVDVEEWLGENQNMGMAWNHPKLIKYMKQRT